MNWFGVEFVVDGYWAAFLGSLVTSIASFVMNAFVPDKKDDGLVVWRS